MSFKFHYQTGRPIVVFGPPPMFARLTSTHSGIDLMRPCFRGKRIVGWAVWNRFIHLDLLIPFEGLTRVTTLAGDLIWGTPE